MTKPKLIAVDVKQLRDLYIATSANLKGLHVADYNLQGVLKDIPDCIKLLYKARDGINVNVRDVTFDGEESHSPFPIVYLAEAA